MLQQLAVADLEGAQVLRLIAPQRADDAEGVWAMRTDCQNALNNGVVRRDPQLSQLVGRELQWIDELLRKNLGTREERQAFIASAGEVNDRIGAARAGTYASPARTPSGFPPAPAPPRAGGYPGGSGYPSSGGCPGASSYRPGQIAGDLARMALPAAATAMSLAALLTRRRG